MHQRYLKVTVTIIAALCLEQSIAQVTEWELEKDRDGIEVYTRDVIGSDIQEFKAITYTSLSMSFLENLIEDADKYNSWQENVTTSKLVMQINPTDMYVHYTTALPWPISDRDVTLISKKTISKNGTVTYSMEAKPEYFPEQENFIRIKIATGVWQFTPVGENKIKILFQFFGDPGGSLPDWIMNLFLVRGPYGTLENMKAMEE